MPESGELPKEIPFELDDLNNLPDWAIDSAKSEERKWGDLEKVKLANDVRWLNVYGWVLCYFTVVFSSLFMISLVLWFWHYITPTSWQWLCEAQLSKIQSVLFSGGMGAVVSSVIRSQIQKAT